MKKIKTNDKKIKLPGYPHYPPSEDILNAGDEKVDTDLENPDVKSNAPQTSGATTGQEGSVPLVPGNEADVTKDDLAALGDLNLSADGGDDEQLQLPTSILISFIPF